MHLFVRKRGRRERVCVFEGVKFNQQEFKWCGIGSYSQKRTLLRPTKNLPQATKIFYDTQRAISHSVGENT